MRQVTTLVLFLLLISQFAMAGNTDATARDAFDEAKLLFQNKQYTAASAKFREAFELKPSWRLMYNIGQSEAAAKRHGLALEAFEHYLAEGGDDIDSERQKEVYMEVARLRKIVGILKVITTENATIWVDGVNRGIAPIPGGLAVGAGTQHTVKSVLDGVTLKETTFRVIGGQTVEIQLYSVSNETPEQAAPDALHKDVEQPVAATASDDDANHTDNAYETDSTDDNKAIAPAPKSPPSTWMLGAGIAGSVLGGGALALGIIFAAKGATHLEKRDNAVREYENSGLRADYEEAKNADKDLATADTVAVAGFIAGGIFTAAGTVLLVMYGKKKRQSRALTTKPFGLGLELTF